jgi:hypothetical protein
MGELRVSLWTGELRALLWTGEQSVSWRQGESWWPRQQKDRQQKAGIRARRRRVQRLQPLRRARLRERLLLLQRPRQLLELLRPSLAPPGPLRGRVQPRRSRPHPMRRAVARRWGWRWGWSRTVRSWLERSEASPRSPPTSRRQPGRTRGSGACCTEQAARVGARSVLEDAGRLGGLEGPAPGRSGHVFVDEFTAKRFILDRAPPVLRGATDFDLPPVGRVVVPDVIARSEVGRDLRRGSPATFSAWCTVDGRRTSTPSCRARPSSCTSVHQVAEVVKTLAVSCGVVAPCADAVETWPGHNVGAGSEGVRDRAHAAVPTRLDCEQAQLGGNAARLILATEQLVGATGRAGGGRTA